MMMLRGAEQKGDRINAYCPVCEASKASGDKHLWYKEENGKLLVKCFKGCDATEILSHFPKSERDTKVPWVLLRQHVYKDARGVIYARKQIYQTAKGKTACWQRYENGEYINKLNADGVKDKDKLKAGLYNVQALAEQSGGEVWIVEGEKDVDTLATHGIVAVSPPNGANQWKAAWNALFTGFDVVISPDNDPVGLVHIEKVARNVATRANSVRTIDLRDLVPDLKKGGDVSDVLAELPDGLDALRELVSKSTPEETKSHAVRYVFGENGPLKTKENLKNLLDSLGITLSYNALTGVEFAGKVPKWPKENEANLFITFLYSKATETGLRMSDKDVGRYIFSIANDRYYNPVTQWLATLPAPQGGIVRKIFDCLIFDAKEQGNKDMYLRLFGKWLIQCIALSQNDPDSPFGAEGVLGLQSEEQGLGKTRFFAKLCFAPKYFKDSLTIDPKNTDSRRIATSFFIGELGEVESTMKKDVAQVKGFVTETTDAYRIPYLQDHTTRPRRTSFCFTCNSMDFLKDEQDRRFWTIPVIGIDFAKLDDIDVNRAWAEAYAAYKQNPQSFRLTTAERQWLIRNNREKFSFRTNEEEVLRDCLDFTKPQAHWSYMTAKDISLKLFGNVDRTKMVGRALCSKLGYTNDATQPRHYKNHSNINKYYVPLVSSNTSTYTRFGTEDEPLWTQVSTADKDDFPF